MQMNDSRNLKASFVELMKSRIFSGVLKPGERLPPERELALQVGMSRGSVNQGILDLERIGLLRIIPRKGTFVADYLKNATPETLSAIMSYDSALIDATLFRDLMAMRILVERECTRLACESLTQEKLDILQSHCDAIYNSGDSEITEAIFLFHKCITEICGNTAYAMVFNSFEKMLRNLIKEHYSNKDELASSLPKFEKLTAAIARRDAVYADSCMQSLLSQASDYLNLHLAEKRNASE